MLTRLSYTTKTDPEEIWRSRVSCLFASDVSNSHPTASCGALFNKEYSITNLHLHNLKQLQLIGYTDADRASSTDDRKSTSGYCFMLNPARPALSWKSKKQLTVRIRIYCSVCMLTIRGQLTCRNLLCLFRRNVEKAKRVL